MTTPFVRVDADGRIIAGVDGKLTYIQQYLAELADGDIAAPSHFVNSHPTGPTIPGSLSEEDSGDMIAVELTAGQSYSWSYRGTADNGIVDPLLRLYQGDGETLIAQDDDGGFGRTSLITFTPTETGTYYLNATSWYQVDNENYQDNGDYTIVQWSPDAGHDAPDGFGTTAELTVGTNYAYIDAPGDNDMYALEVTEGMVYTIAYSGGISGGGDFDGEPGENIAYLQIYDDSGFLGTSLDYESGTSYWAEQSGTIYVRVIPYQATMTGGYTIDIAEVEPSTRDPLESLNWDSANNIPLTDTDGDGIGDTAFVYFAPAGENFGEFEPDDVTPMTTYGWEQHQIDAVMHALQNQYTPITGITYAITTDVEQATFRLLTTENAAYGARFAPQDEAEYGTQQGIGTFNLLSGGFGTHPESLLPGGFSYATILHEFGHAHGIAHPHDEGGGSEVMLGVASSGSLGVYDLNQGVYTVLSYNDAWMTHPDGATEDGQSPFTVIGQGWSETLSALDIAVLQARYGVHELNTGDDVYELNDDYTEASYKTIWDTGGIDTIAYSGDLDAHIDLLAATLDYTPTGGGVVSFLHNDPQPDHTTEVKGGYTIANGVVIENAAGGSGDDVLIGNSANNVLTGNDGADVLMGREGDDKLYGSDGDDDLNGGSGTNHLFGGSGDDTFTFTEGGLNHLWDYQSGETIDLSALGVTMEDVTVKKAFILVDLDGQPDLKIMVKNVDLDDLVFEEPSAAATSASMESAGGTSGGAGTHDELAFARPVDWMGSEVDFYHMI